MVVWICPSSLSVSSVILSVSSKTVSVQARLGKPVLLDCGFWVDPSSPLSGSGFAVEWRYQFRGKGRLVLAYDGKTDRVADSQEEGATLDFEGLHQKGNASLILQETKVRHSGTYICTVHLPYLQAQVAVELEIVGEGKDYVVCYFVFMMLPVQQWSPLRRKIAECVCMCVCAAKWELERATTNQKVGGSIPGCSEVSLSRILNWAAPWCAALATWLMCV